MNLPDAFALSILIFLAGVLLGARAMDTYGKFIPSNTEYKMVLDAPGSTVVPSSR